MRSPGIPCRAGVPPCGTPRAYPRPLPVDVSTTVYAGRFSPPSSLRMISMTPLIMLAKRPATRIGSRCFGPV